MTFTLDDQSARDLRRAAERLNIPKSQVVREALRVYGEQLGRLTERERRAKLEAFDRVMEAVPVRATSEVEKELAEVKRARRQGGRGSSAE